MFGDRLTIDCQPRWKNGHPAQRTTGVLRMNCTQRDQSLCTQSGAFGQDVSHREEEHRQAKRRADPQSTRHITQFGVLFVRAGCRHAFGSSAMPQMGQ